MNTIKFNNLEFELVNYNRNTYFNEGGMGSNGSCSIKTNDYATLSTLGQMEITAIQITHENNVIYDLANISARVVSIGEYLEYDHMNISIELVFDMAE